MEAYPLLEQNVIHSLPNNFVDPYLFTHIIYISRGTIFLHSLPNNSLSKYISITINWDIYVWDPWKYMPLFLCITFQYIFLAASVLTIKIFCLYFLFIFFNVPPINTWYIILFDTLFSLGKISSFNVSGMLSRVNRWGLKRENQVSNIYWWDIHDTRKMEIEDFHPWIESVVFHSINVDHNIIGICRFYLIEKQLHSYYWMEKIKRKV